MPIAIATCAELPDLDEDERRLIDALSALGATARPVVWDDPTVDWASFDAVVLRATWDYSRRIEEFIAWTRRVAAATSLFNPADVVEWNTDKRYLTDLAAAGVPIVNSDMVFWSCRIGRTTLSLHPCVEWKA